MTAPRPVSPILDGFVLGETFSHHGASLCCHAREISSGDHFVVKILSMPESDTQMDALLMAGAFTDRNAANVYFKEQARIVLNETKTLQHMAALSGFLDFDSIQVVPAEQENGYQVYLLSPMRTSFQQVLERADVTQLEIINMALDICVALSSCRHAGFYYADLKPSNVYCVGQHYRIGDLGFLPMSAIGQTPLPERFQSAYTPPELRSGGQLLNNTADVYALGLMLYQAYNGGILPSKDDIVGKLYAPPKYADYEMAEIILRACAPDPHIRWSDPEQIRLALSHYLHRNGVRNTLVAPAELREIESIYESKVEPFLPEEYDEMDFQIPLWDMEPPKVSTSPSDDGTQRRMQSKKSSRHRKRMMITIAVLTLILIAELIIGHFLLKKPDLRIEGFAAAPTADNMIILTFDCTNSSSVGWIVTYSAEGEEEKSLYFTGETVEIPDLTSGVTYTFVLSSQSGREISGTTEISFSLPQS